MTLSPLVVDEFRLGLPKSAIAGEGQAQVEVTLMRGQPGRLVLKSDLAGLTLAIPELAWRKGPATSGQLRAEISLGAQPRVDRLVLQAPGLEAEGRVTLRPDGLLDRASFGRFKMGAWVEGGLEIRGQGKSPVEFALTSGRIDLRRFPDGAGGQGGTGASRITAELEALRVSDGIRIAPFRGDFTLKGGFNGTFQGRVNGEAPVTGTVVPTAHGPAVRIEAQDAGAVARAAGMFASGYGGAMTLSLVPRAAKGAYDGNLRIDQVRVRYGSFMADLLSAISVVGLLDQLGGEGILFDRAEGSFLLTPEVIQVTRGSAIGLSMGVSLEGTYRQASQSFDMQGVVSPIYLLNGIGSVLTRKGEGLFGFAYSLRGTAGDPQVQVNPLSILTPGMFREIFRAPRSTKVNWMNLSDFDFDLPEALIATRPMTPRSAARLLVAEGEAIRDAHVRDLLEVFRPGDRLVLNNTKVIPARLSGTRARGEAVAKVEITLLEPRAQGWRALAKPLRKVNVGEVIRFSGALSAKVAEKSETDLVLDFNLVGDDFDAALAEAGQMPLPPYIAAKRAPDAQDNTDYQTIFARHSGAVAAPTASLHFEPWLLQALADKGVHFTEVTLHVGAGTFLPVKVEDVTTHKMHAEWGEVTPEAAAEINATKAAGGRVIPVGTTALRLIESAAASGQVQPWRGPTDIFIYPGYAWRVTDGLLTNFHLPKSTLLMLVSALMGKQVMDRIYAHAVTVGYRFFSYGDASVLFPTSQSD